MGNSYWKSIYSSNNHGSVEYVEFPSGKTLKSGNTSLIINPRQKEVSNISLGFIND
jgi:hypothetical protein